jgi:hypothetical protein
MPSSVDEIRNAEPTPSEQHGKSMLIKPRWADQVCAKPMTRIRLIWINASIELDVNKY